MIFPNKTKENFKKLCNEIKIIENNNIVTAVQNIRLKVTEYVFWSSGGIDNIKVNKPCTLIMDNNYLYVSDPTQKLNFVIVTVGNNSYQVRTEKGYTNKIKLLK